MNISSIGVNLIRSKLNDFEGEINAPDTGDVLPGVGGGGWGYNYIVYEGMFGPTFDLCIIVAELVSVHLVNFDQINGFDN